MALSPSLAQRAEHQLLAREAELRQMLHPVLLEAGDAAGVHDSKDIAAETAWLAVDDQAQAQLLQELRAVAAALRRLQQGRYGECEDCGEAVGEARLAALPEAACCTDCQAKREAPGARLHPA